MKSNSDGLMIDGIVGYIDRNNIDLNLIDESSKEKGVIFKHFPLQNQVSFGEPDVANANYIVDILSYGALGCLKKEFKGLITGPINKELINKSGFEFSGHTEFLSDISNTKKVVMLLMNKKLKIALLTTHIPLSEVPSKISKKNLEETVSIISEEFKNTWKIEELGGLSGPPLRNLSNQIIRKVFEKT